MAADASRPPEGPESANRPDSGGRGEAGSSALRRVLGGLDAAMLAIGIVVGTGIFAVPGFVAAELGSPGPILLIWLVGGAVTLAGALCYAELAGRFPNQGGGFLYVLHGFGPFAAFFMGWGSFLVGYPGSSAAIAVVFGTYLAAALGYGSGFAKGAAIAAVTLVWILNLRGTRFSGSFQTALTMIKVGALGALAVAALAVGPGQWDRLTWDWSWPPVAAFAAAMVGVIWTFDGWENLTVVAGEVGDPGRKLTRALVGTALFVTLLYLLLNVGYLVLIPFEQLAGSESAASLAAEQVLGESGRRLIASLVVVSSFGALFGIALAAPRFYFALAEHKLFFATAGRVDPKSGAPRWGSTALYLITLVYVATGTFSQILGVYVAITLLYNVLSFGAIYTLRRRLGPPEGFRVPLYPFTPLVVIGVSLWVTGSEIFGEPLRTGIGLGVLALAAPAYALWKRRA